MCFCVVFVLQMTLLQDNSRTLLWDYYLDVMFDSMHFVYSRRNQLVQTWLHAEEWHLAHNWGSQRCFKFEGATSTFCWFFSFAYSAFPYTGKLM